MPLTTTIAPLPNSPVQRNIVQLPISAALYKQFIELSDYIDNNPKGDTAQVGRLLSQFSIELIDNVFEGLLTDLKAIDPNFHEVAKLTEESKNMVRKYMPWAFGQMSMERAGPLIAHYRSLMKVHSQDQSIWVEYPIPAELAARSRASIAEFQTGTVKSPQKSIEVLIDSIDASMEPLFYQPKNLMKFNFITNKTLNGVVSVTMALIQRQLRKLGTSLPPATYEPIGRHLSRFVG